MTFQSHYVGNNPNPVSPKVHWCRPELEKLKPQYHLIKDAIGGETSVKAARTKYLPAPNPTDVSEENAARYEQYLLRAVFYNATRRTLEGMTGQVFSRPSVIELAGDLEPLVKDANGTGVGIEQLAKEALDTVIAYSRSGLFTDFPATEGGITLAQKEQGFIRPTIDVYYPEEIVNWRITPKGAHDVLSLVVLFETYAFGDDGFQLKHAEQYRVLRLDDMGEYTQEIWRELEPVEYRPGKRGAKEYNWLLYETFKPTDANGKPFEEIPFTFIGSRNNDSNPDLPNFYDLASLNIAHYRNSADYEEAVFMVGQPTMVVKGLTDEWANKWLKGKVQMGSRGGIPLGEGMDAEILQAQANDMAFAAMEHKERQMVALGAKLVEQESVQRTATETRLEASADGSVLSSSTGNVEAAFTKALEWCQKFVSNAGTFKFELNKDFDVTKLSPEEQGAAIKAWQDGALAFEEVRNVLRKSGLATLTDEEVTAEALKRKEENIELEGKKAETLAKANPQPAGPVGVGKTAKPAAKKVKTK